MIFLVYVCRRDEFFILSLYNSPAPAKHFDINNKKLNHRFYRVYFDKDTSSTRTILNFTSGFRTNTRSDFKRNLSAFSVELGNFQRTRIKVRA